MSAKIGTGDVLFRVGSGSPSKVYLGSTVVQTVPGTASINYAVSNGSVTSLLRNAAPSDGGSPITGYEVTFDGVEATPTLVFGSEFQFDADYTGQVARIRAVNAIGSGEFSDPVTVT